MNCSRVTCPLQASCQQDRSRVGFEEKVSNEFSDLTETMDPEKIKGLKGTFHTAR